MGVLNNHGIKGERRVMVLTSRQRLSMFDPTVPAVTRQLIPNEQFANKCMTVRPFAIDGNGKQVSRSH